MNKELRQRIKELMLLFDGSFINYNFELILNKQYNVFFRLEDVETKEDIIKKLLWWVSRSSCKGVSDYRQKKIRAALNEFLNIDLSCNEWSCVYCKLGNQVNVPLTDEFINSVYDMAVLKKCCDVSCLERVKVK